MSRETLPERSIHRSLSDFPSLWANLVGRDVLPYVEGSAWGPVRIYERKNELHVELPLPGLKSNDIQVTINKGVLWVRGHERNEVTNKNTKTYRSSSRDYSYSITLPAQINERVEPRAEYANGILSVTLELSKQAETRKINVRTGANAAGRSATTRTASRVSSRTRARSTSRSTARR